MNGVCLRARDPRVPQSFEVSVVEVKQNSELIAAAAPFIGSSHLLAECSPSLYEEDERQAQMSAKMPQSKGLVQTLSRQWSEESNAAETVGQDEAMHRRAAT
ncbi:hypothetical protein HPB51_025781 [Rhipicephalus microplus]|uniref:Uncharacterized protein n=1 Tax=Rhipicephalus microplus TaxID=6941 RepID=A0A9J6EJY7_RHIMP|nr:hypothetical protein HPB51_025781 [Rhipicephalus microplus]